MQLSDRNIFRVMPKLCNLNCYIQWNLDLTKCRGSGKTGSLYWGFVISKTSIQRICVKTTKLFVISTAGWKFFPIFLNHYNFFVVCCYATQHFCNSLQTLLCKDKVFVHNWTLLEGTTTMGENSSVEATRQWERKLVTIS